MPLFSSLLKRNKKSTEAQNDSSNGSTNTPDSAEQKRSRRLSKRDFFRNLVGTNKMGEQGATSELKSTASIAPVPVDTIPEEQPQLPSDPNKPLPPPPPAEVAAVSPTAPPAVQLEKIISPLKSPDIKKLFSGAPQFFVRSEGHHAGPPHPSVAFPWNEEIEIRDLSDHGQIEDMAWGCVTTTPHIIRRPPKAPKGVKYEEGPSEKQRGRFIPRCRERPNMLSIQGLEKGTVGFQAALEIAVADALHEAKPELDPTALQRLRITFLTNKKHGVRPLKQIEVVRRLITLSTQYHENAFNENRSYIETYTELFTQVLHPPVRVIDAENPYSFHVQIEALVDVLTTADIWIDFSNIEWRIRLGQILWGPSMHASSFDPEGEAADAGTDADAEEQAETQEFWLLLQILLSCELLVRLDCLSAKIEKDSKVVSLNEIRRFEREVTRPLKWSLLLARLWLENIRIADPHPKSPSPSEKPATGWLDTLKHVVGTHHDHDTGRPILKSVEFHSRHRKRQVAGLVHFARKLRWADADLITERFTIPQLASMDHTAAVTPILSSSTVGTPLSMTTQRSSYFGGSSRPGVRPGISKPQLSNMFHPSGWLSKSYLTGLILPGEGLSHFLMSTLLENDPASVAKLGEDANLYGGFIYSGQSFWSTACIIGRVLAAGKGASECMGWISSEVVPRNMSDRWINVDVQLEPRSDGAEGPHSARIWKKQTVENDSHVLGNADAGSVLPEDFTLPPPDVRDPVTLVVKLQSLDLISATDSAESTPSQNPTPATGTTAASINTYSAKANFSVDPSDMEKREITFDLTYDVQFVTAHPCVPSKHSRLVSSKANLAPQSPEQQASAELIGPHELFTGHALHKSYQFSRHSLSSIIFAAPNAPPPLLSLHTDSKEVFVIDCTEPSPPEGMNAHPVYSASVSRKRRFGSDLEILARAWCADRGYNALVSRRGRNCIACSIREARALSWKIVLRFG